MKVTDLKEEVVPGNVPNYFYLNNFLGISHGKITLEKISIIGEDLVKLNNYIIQLN